VAVDGVFQHIVAAVNLAGLFALGQHGAVSGWGEEGTNTSTCGAESLGEVTLGDQFQFDFTGTVGLIEVPRVRLAWERANNFVDPALFDQQGQSLFGLSGVVVDDGQVLGASIEESPNELHRLAGISEATNQYRRAVVDIGDSFSCSFYNLCHIASFTP